METALHQHMVRVEKALDQQEVALGFLLDLDGAFKNTCYNSMCAALAKYAVDYTIMQCIRATLEGQLATATLGGLSRSVGASRVCPQGGVLSPLLWFLVVNELLTRLNEGGVFAQGYADDICLIAVGKFPNTVSGLIKCALHTREAWCDELSLSVNPDKCGCFAFTRRRKIPGFFDPRLFGTTLHCSMSIKYLEVILDSRLTWREHMDVKVRKAQNFLWTCKRAYGVTWGLRPRVVHWLYVSIIRPSITFTCWYGGLVFRQPVPRKTKQNPKITMLIDNRSNAHYSHQCCGITHLPPPLKLVVHSKARSAVHHLWHLGCWSHTSKSWTQ